MITSLIRRSAPLARVIAACLVTLFATVHAKAQVTTPAMRADSARLARIAATRPVQAAMAALERDNAWTLDQQTSLCEIPAPPFKETVRGKAFAERLTSIGVMAVRTDGEGNVIGEIRGTSPGPTVLLSGHLDTVFPEGTDVHIKREGGRLSAPGIGDDCRGLAVTLAVARQLVAAKVPFAGRLLVVATVGEEGPGNLRGVRALFTGPLKDSIDVFLSVDGTGFGITNGAVGSNRYRVTYVGPGGHSYGAFGMPNPIHALGRAIGKIADLQASTSPRVTFNVGLISGGTSVNSISASASMDVDLRSESATALAEIDGRLQSAIRDALKEELARWPKSTKGLTLKVDTIGLRPAGNTPDSANVVRTAQGAANAMGIYAALNFSSTDANIPISLGIPALTLDGGGRSANAHALDEWYEDGRDGFKGPQWVMLIVLGLLGAR